jgi:GAF domain-containing protein
MATQSRFERAADHAKWLPLFAQCISVTVGDGCVIRLLANGGWLAPVAVHLPFDELLTDESVAARIRAHVAAPHNVVEQEAARRILETGEALRVAHLDRAQLMFAATAEIAEAFEAIRIHSLLLVALRRRAESIGLLAMVRFVPSSRPYNQHDQDIVQAIADHVTLAIDAARELGSGLRQVRARGERPDPGSSEHGQAELSYIVAHELGVVTDLIRSYVRQVGGDPSEIQVLDAAVRRMIDADSRL